MRRVPVANVSQVLIDAKDFLQDDNARTITTGGQGQIGVELTSIKRFHCDHFCSFPPRESFIREVEWIGQCLGTELFGTEPGAVATGSKSHRSEPGRILGLTPG